MPNVVKTRAKIGVLGASGYTGAELLRFLIHHEGIEIALLTAERRAGQHMRQVFPQFSPYSLPKLLAIESVDWNKAALDLAFCALPHATTQRVIKALLASAPGTKVIDLSEIYRNRIKSARLVANPGCYTTCAELALIPLLSAKAIDPDEIVIDAKSGMTGAGRAAKEEMLFSEVSEGFHAYGVGHHRHMAELDQEFSAAAGREVIPTFTPHLVPMNRGILSTIYLRCTTGTSAEDLHATLL